MILLPKLTRVFQNAKKFPVLLVVILMVWLVCLLDYITGPEISMALFYLLPVAIAAWYAGRLSGYAIAAISTMAWMIADLLSEASHDHTAALYWNALTRMWVMFVIVWLMSRLQSLQAGLENAVAERTAILQGEVARREQLERDLLAATDRERERIGRDLHDGMGQHLAAAIALCTTIEQQPIQNCSGCSAVGKIATAVQRAAMESRQLARGLYPAELLLGGLSDAIGRLCQDIQTAHKVECQFVCLHPVIISDGEKASHLFRVAQEAINNAVKHADPKHILVALTIENGRLILIVKNDGAGVPAARNGTGTGMHTMAYRARIIGATLAVGPAEPDSGTILTCSLPLESTSVPSGLATAGQFSIRSQKVSSCARES